ncbi:MAG: glycosyltransferase family 2 protein [Terracidiphilus sp.]
MEYSIVIPVHNEAAHLETQVSRFVESLPVDLAVLVKEIILVENGSTDSTSEVCGKLESRYPLLVRPVCIARGSYGEAIKRGMLECRGTHLSILECDVLDCDFVARSVAVFRTTDTEVIVGSKRLPEAVDRRPFKRRALTYLYNTVFLRLCMGYPGTDTHGLKSFQTPVAQGLCAKAVTTDEVFQTEIILLAWRCGFRIKEIPLSIEETRASAISIRRRLPKVINTIHELRNSLNRFPAQRNSDIAADPASAVKTSAPANK